MKTKQPVAVLLPRWIGSHLQALQFTRRSWRLLPALILLSACAVASAQTAIKTGPEVGSTVPGFEAPDQNGSAQNLQSIMGPKGALLVFYRSSDW
ncbi:MAG: hypothetical protein ACLQVG_26980 [Terriglobia bacterium]